MIGLKTKGFCRCFGGDKSIFSDIINIDLQEKNVPTQYTCDKKENIESEVY